MDSSGTTQWQKRFGGTGTEEFGAMDMTPDGTFIVAGRTEGATPGEDDLWIFKISSTGDYLWNKRIDAGAAGEGFIAGAATSDGGFIAFAVGVGVYGYRFDAAGDIVWQKEYVGDWIAQIVHQTRDGFIVGGFTLEADFDVWIGKMTDSGSFEWERTLGGTGYDSMNEIALAWDGGYVTAGQTESFGAGSRDVWVTKLDSSGILQWQRTYGGESGEAAFFVEAAADGGYLVSGWDWEKTLALKLYSNGDIQWQRLYGDDDTITAGAYASARTLDGGHAWGGVWDFYGNKDFWLSRADSTGFLSSSCGTDACFSPVDGLATVSISSSTTQPLSSTAVDITLGATATAASVISRCGDAPAPTVTENTDSPARQYEGVAASERATCTGTLGAISPNRGGDTGSITAFVTIAGISFQSGVSVKLVRSGQTDILAYPIGYLSPNRVKATFDLLGKEQGSWDVVVTNPDGSTASLASAFTVEPGRDPTFSVVVLGPTRARAGALPGFGIAYRNDGNVNAYGMPLWIAFPNWLTMTPFFDVTDPVVPGDPDPIDWTQVPISYNTSAETIVPLLLMAIPPGAGQLRFALKMPTDPQYLGREFDVHAWMGSSVLESYSPGGPGQRAMALMSPEAVDCIKALQKVVSDILGFIPGAKCLEEAIKLTGDGFADQITSSLGTQDTTHDSISFFQTMMGVAKLAVLCTPGASWVLVAGIQAVQTGVDIALALRDCERWAIKVRESRKRTQIVSSSDPNDKGGPDGAGDSRYFSGTEPLPYLIQFENLPSATAPAQAVVVTDQLDATTLDLASFRLGAMGFGDRVLEAPPGATSYATEVDLRPDMNLRVRLSAALDTGSGTVTWTFQSIDPVTGLPPDDPLAGFLPANVEPPAGQGFVSLVVDLQPALPDGTEVRNEARIVFDSNPPIDTPEWLNTVDNDKPVSQVQALAASQSAACFQVQWSGSDTVSGIQDYSVYVSEDGAASVAWLQQTDNTSEVFHGVPGRTYAFYSVARDLANNVEDAPGAADTTTLVAQSAPLSFTLACDPSSLAVASGVYATSTCTVSSACAMDSVMRFQCPNLVSGLYCSFNPGKLDLSAGASSDTSLQVLGDSSLAQGAHPFTVQAWSGALTQTLDMTALSAGVPIGASGLAAATVALVLVLRRRRRYARNQPRTPRRCPSRESE
ncbi:MAG: hypothetical protein HYV63_18050 [Candidatus Schekmanbacteria bacterium]|nr:hypothetical protein [Candidatus Schekmanbacteria bacterium]